MASSSPFVSAPARRRVLVQVLPWKVPAQYGADIVVEEFEPWVLAWNETASLTQMRTDIVESFEQDLHQGKGKLRMKYLRNGRGVLLPRNGIVGDYFEDFRGSNVVAEDCTVQVVREPPTLDELRKLGSARFGSVAPEHIIAPFLKRRAEEIALANDTPSSNKRRRTQKDVPDLQPHPTDVLIPSTERDETADVDEAISSTAPAAESGLSQLGASHSNHPKGKRRRSSSPSTQHAASTAALDRPDNQSRKQKNSSLHHVSSQTDLQNLEKGPFPTEKPSNLNNSNIGNSASYLTQPISNGQSPPSRLEQEDSTLASETANAPGSDQVTKKNPGRLARPKTRNGLPLARRSSSRAFQDAARKQRSNPYDFPSEIDSTQDEADEPVLPSMSKRARDSSAKSPTSASKLPRFDFSRNGPSRSSERTSDQPSASNASAKSHSKALQTPESTTTQRGRADPTSHSANATSSVTAKAPRSPSDDTAIPNTNGALPGQKLPKTTIASTSRQDLSASIPSRDTRLSKDKATTRKNIGIRKGSLPSDFMQAESRSPRSPISEVELESHHAVHLSQGKNRLVQRSSSDSSDPAGERPVTEESNHSDTATSASASNVSMITAEAEQRVTHSGSDTSKSPDNPAGGPDTGPTGESRRSGAVSAQAPTRSPDANATAHLSYNERIRAQSISNSVRATHRTPEAASRPPYVALHTQPLTPAQLASTAHIPTQSRTRSRDSSRVSTVTSDVYRKSPSRAMLPPSKAVAPPKTAAATKAKPSKGHLTDAEPISDPVKTTLTVDGQDEAISRIEGQGGPAKAFPRAKSQNGRSNGKPSAQPKTVSKKDNYYASLFNLAQARHSETPDDVAQAASKEVTADRSTQSMPATRKEASTRKSGLGDGVNSISPTLENTRDVVGTVLRQGPRDATAKSAVGKGEGSPAESASDDLEDAQTKNPDLETATDQSGDDRSSSEDSQSDDDHSDEESPGGQSVSKATTSIRDSDEESTSSSESEDHTNQHGIGQENMKRLPSRSPAKVVMSSDEGSANAQISDDVDSDGDDETSSDAESCSDGQSSGDEGSSGKDESSGDQSSRSSRTDDEESVAQSPNVDMKTTLHGDRVTDGASTTSKTSSDGETGSDDETSSDSDAMEGVEVEVGERSGSSADTDSRETTQTPSNQISREAQSSRNAVASEGINADDSTEDSDASASESHNDSSSSDSDEEPEPQQADSTSSARGPSHSARPPAWHSPFGDSQLAGDSHNAHDAKQNSQPNPGTLTGTSQTRRPKSQFKGISELARSGMVMDPVKTSTRGHNPPFKMPLSNHFGNGVSTPMAVYDVQPAGEAEDSDSEEEDDDDDDEDENDQAQQSLGAGPSQGHSSTASGSQNRFMSGLRGLVGMARR